MLDNINNKKPFSVPDNYFDNFHKELMDKIPQEKKSKVVPLWKKVLPWTAIAAVLSGIILTVGIPTSTTVPQLSNNATDEYNSFPQNDIYASFDADDFYLFLEDEVAKDAYVDVVY